MGPDFRWGWGAAAPILLAAVTGCGDSTAEEPDPTPPDPPVECEVGDLVLEDGRCWAPGVHPEHCAAGFEPGVDGCDPVLPAEPCPPGTMALLGETACREVAPCGDGPWGDIPVEASTQFVDANYPGNDSDGSEMRPWTRVADGIAAASSGAIVALAEGSYVEDVTFTNKALRLWGRCPSLVEIVGVGSDAAAVIVRPNAQGSELRGFAVRGPLAGVIVAGSTEVLLDSLWVHDSGRGIEFQGLLGETQGWVRHTLVEEASELGITYYASSGEVESSVVRDTQPAADGSYGRGVQLNNDPAAGRATVRLAGVILERNRDMGVQVLASDLTVEGSLIRDTLPEEADQGTGRGVALDQDLTTLEQPNAYVFQSVLARNHEAGAIVSGGALTLEQTSVIDTLPRASAQDFGQGVVARDAPETGARALLTIVDTTFARNQDNTIFVAGSDALVERTLVHQTYPEQATSEFGNAMGVQDNPVSGQGSTATIRDSRFLGSHSFGLIVFNSAVAMERTMIDDVAPRPVDQQFGDGVVVIALPPYPPSLLTISESLIGHAARAGVAGFGAAVSIFGSMLTCNDIDLNSEASDVGPSAFEDLGGNQCGCEEQSECKVVTANLAPPAPPE